MSVDRQVPKDARRDAAREKARQMREAAARRHRRNRVLAITSGIVVLLLVAGGAALALRGSGASAAAPPGVTADGGVLTGPATAAHHVVIYQDYQCPYCKAFDTSVGPWLEQQRDAGTTTVEYRVISFLDRSSGGTQFSTRSASAAACLARAGDKVFTKFNDTMYAQQPPENGTGLPDKRIVAIAAAAGATPAQQKCIDRDDHRAWVAQASASATKDHQVTATPTVLVDGKALDDPSKDALATALGVSSS